MSKEAEARVRDELLQSLYAGVLRGSLSFAHAGLSSRREASLAVAAGVSASLRPADLLLLPAAGAAAFRVLRGLAPLAVGAAAAHTAAAAGVLPLPRLKQAAVAYALGAAAAARHGGSGALVCVLLPATAVPQVELRRTATPANWSEAGAHAARLGLPLLLVTDRPRPPRKAPAPAHRRPAPLYPSIPVDRDDALAVYRVAYECAARARAGGGPSHLLCNAFRVEGQAHVPAAGESAALVRLEAMLRRRGAFTKAWQRQLERRLVREIAG